MSEPINETQEIAQALGERRIDLVNAVITTLGLERARAFLEETRRVEAAGGMTTKNEQRRRTPGGVFFQLIKDQVTKEERKAIFALEQKKKKKKKRSATKSTEQRAPLTWEEAKQLIAQAIKTTGEARTVKVTLIGRPLKIIQQKDCVVVSMKGREPKTLPKGLPPVPEGSAITWAVFIVTKQWNRVKESIEANESDQLIIEGYPIVGKGGIAAVMTTNCKSVLMERAQRSPDKE